MCDDSPALAETTNDTKRVDDDLDLETLSQTKGVESSGEQDSINFESADNGPFKLRSYQDEMLNESLKRNTIVVLDTGAGKTHIALARMRAELETNTFQRMAWFLAPTVALCHQHCRSISVNLPAYQIRLLTSEDNVDRWTDQATWDGVLHNMRIVISTYGVLYDALCHGFVKINNLGLCVFDEAHHCMKRHASNMIMQEFYKPAKESGLPIPSILGLSASPVMNAKVGGLEMLEANLDSRAITPRLQRSELMQYVHVPTLIKRSYPITELDSQAEDSLLGKLTNMIWKYDIKKDPYILDIRQMKGPEGQIKLEKTLMSRKTYCTDQLNALRLRAETVARHVSLSASNQYIQACRDKFLNGLRQSNPSWMPELSDKEKHHLAVILGGLQSSTQALPPSMTSPKAQLLLHILMEEASDTFTGIIFVEQKAVVAALSEYLLSLPGVARLFNIGTFVGGSSYSKSKGTIGDIIDVKEQQQTLEDFRVGKKNLIIATSVLEEGMDISSCQTVICFDAPLNLTSFVQRRGRARKKDSKYIILLADDDSKGEPARWHELEARMKAAYESEFRNAQLAAELERMNEKEDRKYQVPSTGALLTLDNAKSHLAHFCATLQSTHYFDHRPAFSCHTDSDEMVTAEVMLPASVSKKYRKATSAHGWRTEKAAMKDAAFQACVALHSGGLLNDHLLPLRTKPADQAKQNRPALIEVEERISPWSLQSSDAWHEHVVEVEIPGQPSTLMSMFLPVACPSIPKIDLHWAMSVKGVAKVKYVRSCTLSKKDMLERQKSTELLLQSVCPSYVGKSKNYAVIFDFKTKLGQSSLDTIPAEEVLKRQPQLLDIGLVSIKGQIGRSYVLSSMPPRSSIESNTDYELELVRFPRKREFLTAPGAESRKNRLTSMKLPVSQCMIQTLPVRYSVFAACIPSILHRVEDAILATTLQSTLLKPIGIKDWNLIVEATTSGNADFAASYERLEYLGDAILKYFTHVQLTAQHPDWYEGLLTAEKGRTNGNASLSQACLESGLDRYISTLQFTGKDWHLPLLIETTKTGTEKKEERTKVERSTKTLADVVEAMIGASFIDQGLPGALSCIKLFLPNEQWFGLPECHNLLLNQVPNLEKEHSSSLLPLEQLIGYHFNKPTLLLEAITHPSYTSTTTDSLSYERLEFLGDAVIDQLLIPRIFSHQHPRFKNHQMHRLRQSLANAHFLGFCNMHFLVLSQERFDPISAHNNNNDDEKETTKLEKITNQLHLHDFLRCDANTRKSFLPPLSRHETLQKPLLSALETSDTYPWPDLLCLNPPKCFSDLIEAVMGAVYIDSKGDMDVCAGFLDKCGVLGALKGFLDRGVDVMFPKERLGLVVDRENVVYRCFRTEDGAADDGGMWACEVLVKGVVVAEVGGCWSKEEAKNRGAVEAVRILSVQKGLELTKVVEDGDVDMSVDLDVVMDDVV